MNALLLAAVLLGQCQQVNGKVVCRPIQATATRTTLRTDKHGICVRIIAPEPDGKQSWGSGTLIGGDQSRAYVLTNRHVVGDAAEVLVWHKSGPFVGRVIRSGRVADLAVVMIRRPDYVWPLVIAQEPPTGIVRAYGFPGVSNVLVKHEGRLTWSTPPNINAFDFGIANGESGAGIFNTQGELVGVAFGSDPSHRQYAAAVSHARLREFLGVELCDERTITISPFFLRFRRVTQRDPDPTLLERLQDRQDRLERREDRQERQDRLEQLQERQDRQERLDRLERLRERRDGQPLSMIPPDQAQRVSYLYPNEAVPPPEIGPSGPVPQDAGLPPTPKIAPPVSKVTPSPQQPTQLPAERTPRFASPQTLPADLGGPMPMMALQPTAVDIPITVRATIGFSILRGALREALEAR